jgi:acyl-CoA hydrolase
MSGRTVEMEQDFTTPELISLLRPGDTVLVGQATAEPPGLVRMLLDAAGSVPGLTAFCGYTLSDAWRAIGTAGPRIKTYAAHGVFRELMKRGGVDVLPVHLSAVEGNIVSGRLPVDVVMLQVGPKDQDGYYSLGPTVDYASAAVGRTRVVLVEVNQDMPRARTSRRLHESQVTRAVDASAPLAGSPARMPSEIERRVARNVAGLVESGATVQLGAGALAEAVAEELRSRRDLQVRSGLVGDWLVDLYENGAIRSGDDITVASMALGTRRLYDFVDSNPAVGFVTHGELVDPVAVAACGSFVAINSAIEVDLAGAINSEVVGGRYVGAVGGQVDFFRATRATPGGLAVVALASTHPSGESRIVTALEGPVTSLKSDVDVVVTEWGVADLRAASLEERAQRLLAVAAPEHRDEIAAS